MEYNTARDKLIISEYGRNFQKIVNEIVAEPDKKIRTEMTERLVEIMSSFNTEVASKEDYKHTLYDHVYIMSDGKLDIDFPYPLPDPKENKIVSKPKYNTNNIKLRPYGKYIQTIIEKAVDYEDGLEKEELVKTIANILKKMYLNWNRDSVDDELIFEHLDLLSDGQLKLRDSDKLKTTSEILKIVNKQEQTKTTTSSNKRKRKRKDNYHKKRQK